MLVKSRQVLTNVMPMNLDHDSVLKSFAWARAEWDLNSTDFNGNWV